MVSDIWSVDLLKNWEKQGKTEYLKWIKQKYKDNKLAEWRRDLYELVMNGVSGAIKKDSVVTVLEELAEINEEHLLTLVDIFMMIDAELQGENRSNFCFIVKESERMFTGQILKERLDIDSLQEVGTLKNLNFQTKFIKVKTKLYYKQRKFNLFREESEGYSKLIVELNQDRTEAELTMLLEVIKSLIGYFNLDPNRVLDIILETFENKLDRDALFIPLIRSYMSDQQVICEVLGFKYCSTANDVSPSLQKLTAFMLRYKVIDLDNILPWLVPDDKIIFDDFDQDMKEAKEYVKKMAIISTKDKEEEKEEKKVVVDKFPKNQKFGLCKALVDVGAWEVAQSLFNRYPDYCMSKQKQIALSLCGMVNGLLEPIYRRYCSLSHKSQKKVCTFDASSDLTNLSEQLVSALNILGPYLHFDPVLVYKIVRLCQFAIKQCQLDTNKMPTAKDSTLYYNILTILDVSLLPTLSFMDCNCCVAEEIWNIIKYFSYQSRYSLYSRWKNEMPLQHAELLIKRSDSQKKIKHIMKRVSKETIKHVGRGIGKLTHSSPGFLFDYVIIQIQLYDNLIGPVVDSFKYLTNLSYDVLGYCLIEALSSAEKNKYKHDSTSISPWLQSLASFCGFLLKKYNIELTGLLQYVANQLKAQKSLDLLILKEIVQKMAGIEGAEELTSDQLDAMAGGELLKSEVGSFGQIKNTKKSSQRLKDTLSEHDLAVVLCLLMAQQKHCVVYQETEQSHLKLVGKLYDQCHDALVQFGTFLGSTMTVDEYVNKLPSIHLMLRDYHIHSDVAFFLARPMFQHAIHNKYDVLRKSDVNYKKMSVSTKHIKYIEAVKSVMEPVATSVRPLHPAKVWEDISPQFLVTFWSLSMFDLYVPTEAYQREINKLNKLASQAADSKDLSLSKGKKEQERLVTLAQKLDDEKKKQEEHVEKVLAYLKQEKDSWFLSRSAKSAKNETITQFLQLCLFPRCTFTLTDSLYCAKFVHTIHSLKTANFSTLLCYDRLFCDITYSVTSCTENEANRYGRFLCLMLETVMRWHSEKVIFDKECSNYPGFVTKFRVSNQFSEANDMVGFENYRHVCHKWHYKITKAIVVCLDSKDYVQIRNSLIILIKILPHFPILAKLSQILERKVEKVRDEERGKRQDLHALAISYCGQLKTKAAHMMRESDFHHVGDKTSKEGDGNGEKLINGTTSKENSNGSNDTNTADKGRKIEDKSSPDEASKKEELKDDEEKTKDKEKDRDGSNVPIVNSDASDKDSKRKKVDNNCKEIRKVDNALDKKDRSARGKVREDQREQRKEKKQGRKRQDRGEDILIAVDQKRRKDNW